MAKDQDRTREIVIDVDVESMGKMRKEGHGRGFTVHCDERAQTGGDNTAPSPMVYFALSLGFWLLTQISQYGEMMRTEIRKARVYVKAKFGRTGSVLAETIQSKGLALETRLELESDEPAERVAAVARNAENGCFILQSILQPVPVERSFVLNGNAFDPQGFSK